MGLLFAKSAREDANMAKRMAGLALMSSGVMALRTAFLLGLFRFELLLLLAPALASMASISFGLGILWVKGSIWDAGRQDPASEDLRQAAPFDLFLTLRLAGTIALVMLAAKLARQVLGDKGVIIVSFLAGLGDVDAVTLSLARGLTGQDQLIVAAIAIGMAIAANQIMKSCLALVVGGRRHGLWVLAANLVSLLVAAIVTFAVFYPTIRAGVILINPI
jgi:uncharacterized membrane protein (DUF4010 family)